MDKKLLTLKCVMQRCMHIIIKKTQSLIKKKILLIAFKFNAIFQLVRLIFKIDRKSIENGYIDNIGLPDKLSFTALL